MNKSKSNILLSISIISFSAILFLAVPLAARAVVLDLTGWAWSETTGWISFNSSDAGAGGSSYRVSVDTDTGIFSGYAWSSNIGWITFDRSQAGAPPYEPCAQNNCLAVTPDRHLLGVSNVYIHGWARALSYGGGWDGWIRFNHSGSGSGDAYIDNNLVLHGWAWSDGPLGWISFNSSDSGAGGSAYAVSLTVSCSCSWSPTACGDGPCNIDQRRQVHTCLPSPLCSSQELPPTACSLSCSCQHSECDEDHFCQIIAGPGTNECGDPCGGYGDSYCAPSLWRWWED